MDGAARVVLVNDCMLELCGLTQPEMVGQDWFARFVPEQEREQMRETFDSWLRLAPGTHSCLTVCPIIARHSALQQIQWELNTVNGADGELLGVLAIGHDITEILVLRAKLAESQRLANIGMRASVLVHEVSNPLNAMYLHVQLLGRRVAPPNRDLLQPDIDSMLTEIMRLTILLDDFRANRDLAPGKMSLTLTDLGAVVVLVAELLSARAAECAVELAWEIERDLPMVLGNSDKIKQVLINLCKNAMEAMPNGGKLQVIARSSKEHVFIDVIDDGPGLPAEIDVFAPFSTTKVSGTGLGLPLAREIVEGHGGSLRCESNPERGTVFTIAIPKC